MQGEHDHIASTIGCPFYRKVDRKHITISCEGLFDGSVTKLQFRHMDQVAKHTDMYCCDDWESCPVWQLLMTYKYSE